MNEQTSLPPELTFLKYRSSSSDRLIGRHKYHPYAVFVPFLTIQGQTHWLFEVRARGIRQGGEVCFPGGGVELQEGEEPKEAAIRETAEELGISQENIKVFGCLGHLVTHWGGVIDVFYGTLDSWFPDFTPQNDEVSEAFTVPLSYFLTTPPEVYYFQQVIKPNFKDPKKGVQRLPWKELGLPSLYGKPWTLRTYPVYFYQWGGKTIWGLTADIIREMLEILKS
ncbi:MAG: CoA pyrophosphatase [Spirochaetales bacterium]